jgi:hypothetical protein
MKKSLALDAKRERAAAKIKEVAPHIEALISMLDETRVDLILIALSGETLPGGEE